MNSHKKLVLASLAICAAVVGTVGVAAISNSDGLQAVNIVKADPVVTLTTLTYDDFDWGKLEQHYTEFWVTSPNGNKIGIYLGGNLAIGGEEGHGELTLVKDEGAYVDTRGLTTDSSARKYAFSQIKSINVSFNATEYLMVEYRSGGNIVNDHLSNNKDLNLDNSDYFKIFPSSGTVNITSIRVTYNSTGDFCNQLV